MNAAQAPKVVLENILEVLEYERKRISLNLHDSVQNKLRLLRDDIKDPVQRQQIDEILDELRNIAYNLVPKSLQEFSLAEYLVIYSATINKTYLNQLHIDYRTNITIEVPKDIETELFNIVQECMTNIIKYADSPIVLLRYKQLPDSIQIIVQDVGKGFDLEEAMRQESIGLKSIQARTALIGGEYEIKSDTEGGGTKVKINVPIKSEWQNIPKTIFDEDLENRLAGTPMSGKMPPINKWTFLLVDNQPEITEGLIGVLKKTWRNATYIACTNVADAKLILQHKDIDVVITDITMPNNSGLELAAHLQEHYPKVKTIIYSINDNPVYVYRAINKLKVNGYVWKEQNSLANVEHPLLTAIKQINDTPETPYYSPQIAQTRSYMEQKEYDMGDDKKSREIFKGYALVLKALRAENWAELHALVKEIRESQEIIKTKMEAVETAAMKNAEYYARGKWTEKGNNYKKRERDKLINELNLKTSVPITIAQRVAERTKHLSKIELPATTIDRYFRRAKELYQIDDDWQLFQLIINVAEDFGLLNETDSY